MIKGWDQGCLGMQVGETRELIIPADEGYGAGGFPAWGIPPGGTLNFTLEVSLVACLLSCFVCFVCERSWADRQQTRRLVLLEAAACTSVVPAFSLTHQHSRFSHQFLLLVACFWHCLCSA